MNEATLLYKFVMRGLHHNEHNVKTYTDTDAGSDYNLVLRNMNL